MGSQGPPNLIRRAEAGRWLVPLSRKLRRRSLASRPTENFDSAGSLLASVWMTSSTRDRGEVQAIEDVEEVEEVVSSYGEAEHARTRTLYRDVLGGER